jgi:hypothetical protein
MKAKTENGITLPRSKRQIELLVRRLRNKTGKKCFITWLVGNIYSWHDFYVGNVTDERVLLFGTKDKDGNLHDGVPFWIDIKEIKRVNA